MSSNTAVKEQRSTKNTGIGDNTRTKNEPYTLKHTGQKSRVKDQRRSLRTALMELREQGVTIRDSGNVSELTVTIASESSDDLLAIIEDLCLSNDFNLS